MTETRHYTVAGHTFSVTAGADCFGLMGNYGVFESGDVTGEAVFTIDIADGDRPEYTEEFRQEEDGQIIVCGYSPEREAVFEFVWGGETTGWLIAASGYHNATLVMAGERYKKLAIDNALMVMFALATADKGTVLFHAAVVSHKGKGYMFLGPSGTGKSTHARLWLEHIEGTELVNDDNPVVRDGVVYGSPWSGKTPCYRNVSYPLGGIVLLSQAPYNKISILKGLQAYVALVASISGKRWDSSIADGLHDTENKLATEVPMWQLECLPDRAAAELCQSTIEEV
jgi:hypothetical protein